MVSTLRRRVPGVYMSGRGAAMVTSLLPDLAHACLVTGQHICPTGVVDVPDCDRGTVALLEGLGMLGRSPLDLPRRSRVVDLQVADALPVLESESEPPRSIKLQGIGEKGCRDVD